MNGNVCADVVIESWMTDDYNSFKSYRVQFEFAGNTNDILGSAYTLDSLIQQYAENIQAKYLSGGMEELNSREFAIAPTILGIYDC